MGWTSEHIRNGVQKKLFVKLSPVEKSIFDCLKPVPHESLDKIAIGTQNSVSKTAMLLLKFEMKGCENPCH